jgi:lantibiotic modifying enzyme
MFLKTLNMTRRPKESVPDVTAPGLMTGIAGMGYQLLRLAEPGRIPSVLLLEPPSTR